MVQLPATAAIEYVAAGHFSPGVFWPGHFWPGVFLSGRAFPGGLLTSDQRSTQSSEFISFLLAASAPVIQGGDVTDDA